MAPVSIRSFLSRDLHKAGKGRGSLSRVERLLNTFTEEEKSSEEDLSDADDALSDEDYVPSDTSESDQKGSEPGPSARARPKHGDSNTEPGPSRRARARGRRGDSNTRRIDPGPSGRERGERRTPAALPADAARRRADGGAAAERQDWRPLDYVQRYMDSELIKLIADCTNAMSLDHAGCSLNTSANEIYHFFGAAILMCCVPYPRLRMFWSNSFRIPAISDTIGRDRFFKLSKQLKAVVDNYRKSVPKRKWTLQMLMRFTHLALADSWLLYRQDEAERGSPGKAMKFLEFRMTVAQAFLAKCDAAVHRAPEADEQPQQLAKKRRVTAVPHLSVRTTAARHLPEMKNLKNPMRCRLRGCSGKSRTRCVTCDVFLCLQTERNCFAAFHRASPEAPNSK